MMPHPEAPWSSSYMLNRLREVVQNENLAHWKKSYVAAYSAGIYIVIPEDITSIHWGARPTKELAHLIDIGGWGGQFGEVDGVSLPYITFIIRPNEEK